MLRRRLLLVLLLVAPALLPAAVADGRERSPRLHAFRSCSNLLGYAQRNGVRVIRESASRRGTGGGLVEPLAGGDEDSGGGGAAPAPAVGREGESTSPTNVQEAGVDEPDWVKAAGSILFAARGGRLHAIDAAASTPVPLGSLELPGESHELLVHGDRALVIATLGFGGDGPVAIAGQVGTVPPREWLGRTRLLELDVSDPRAMRVLRTLDVEGGHVGARLTGATARVVIATQPRGLAPPRTDPESGAAQVRRRWRRSVRRTRTASWLPAAVLRDRRTGRTRRRALLGCRQVRRTQAFSGLGMLTVLTVDMSAGRAALPPVDADALMTSGETVYASRDRLYVASQRWLGVDPSRAEILDEAATGLHAFATTQPGQTAYAGSGEVPGYLLNQWSLSEHEGVLRAATTSMPPWQSRSRSQSAVRTLQERDGRLVELGRVGGLGEGEQIYAVRYLGDTAFVVTFRQTDPLYTLDLSEPQAPRVVGELKVPGYSAYLHPLEDGLLLGVGQDATAQGTPTGVQLSLFDVADLRNPVRLAQRGLGRHSQTDVDGDHHAFLWSAPERLAVIPVLRYERDPEAAAFAGAIAFRVDRAGGVQEVARFPHPPPAGDDPWTPVFARSLVVGGRLLLLSDRGLLSTSLAAPGPGDFVPYPR